QLAEAISSNPVLLDKKLLCEATFPFLVNVKKAPYPGQRAVLDAVRTLWFNQDQKFLKALELFRELLERDRQSEEKKNAA
ncbi:MAG TPA: hypothetical protein VGR71_17110, partial [Nitrospira sp.]|nr:hypothetical protein [Nitrospira sp.]